MKIGWFSRGKTAIACAAFALAMWTVLAGGFEGRWNVTEDDGKRISNSWLEITRDGDGWKGLFLHRGGHPMAAEVTVQNDTLTVTMIPDEPGGDASRPNQKQPTLSGKLESGKLVGTGTTQRGDPFKWTGVPAPDRTMGSDRKVTWGAPVTLFNGNDLSGWKTIGTRESQWKAVDGILTNQGTGANIRTVDEFRDFKLHIEFKIPAKSNSGIYLRGRYETQVADTHGMEPFSRGVGGIYGHITPTVNAAKPAGEWNTVEATIVGYRVTLVVNGQTTIDGELLPGITGGALDTNETAPGPIMLQGDHGAVYYRNIVLTPAN